MVKDPAFCLSLLLQLVHMAGNSSTSSANATVQRADLTRYVFIALFPFRRKSPDLFQGLAGTGGAFFRLRGFVFLGACLLYHHAMSHDVMKGLFFPTKSRYYKSDKDK